MKKILILIAIIAFTLSTKAQKTIAVLSGSNWTFYTDFSIALRQCASGSTIYLPGGSFPLSQSADTINKQINIIGVGHYSDSTTATEPTILQGNLLFDIGGNNVNLVGIRLIGDINSLGRLNNINNISILRCNINFAMLSSFNNVNISECVISLVSSNSNISNNIVIKKSIILGNYLANLLGARIENCIVNALTGTITGCSFSSCIFTQNVVLGSNFNNNTFSHNLICGILTISGSNVALSNNVSGVSLSNTFENFSNNGAFSYNNDFHLLPTSAGRNAGLDGTDVGIYGTTYPYKPSAVPANPHISTKSIAPQSAPNGTLPVNIRVIAQDR